MAPKNLLSIFLTLLTFTSVTFANWEDCPYEALPLDLDTLGLDDTTEVHIQGDYFVPSDTFAITFTLSEESLFR